MGTVQVNGVSVIGKKSLNYENNPIKNGQKSMRHHIFQHSRAGNSRLKSAFLPKFELIRDIMPVLAICKYEDNPIKMAEKAEDTIFFHDQGQITPNSKVRSR